MYKLDTSFCNIIKDMILKNPFIRQTYIHKHPNTKYSIDTIINDILYVLKTGISWRNVRSIINWNTLYWHFSIMSKCNIFKDVFNNLRNQYISKHDMSIQIIDSTFIMNKCGKNKIARNKFFKNKNCNKISIITDIRGEREIHRIIAQKICDADFVPLSALIDSGNKHDLSFVLNNVKDIRHFNKHKFTLLADKGYVSRNLKEQLINFNCNLIYPPKRNMKQQVIDKQLYSKRIYVEHAFQKIKQFKRISVRYDSNIDTFTSFVYLSLALLINRNITCIY
jgi:transposase